MCIIFLQEINNYFYKKNHENYKKYVYQINKYFYYR